MTLTLTVDGDRWRAHLRQVADENPGLVPVLKGNGYGFGVPRLARRAAWLGVDTVAVGTYAEVPEVLTRFDGDVLVLSPWRPFLPELADPQTYDPRVVHTVGRTDDLRALAQAAPAGTRVVLEGVTSMARHGFDRHALTDAAGALGRLRMVGFAVHLPMTGGHLDETDRWAAAVEASRLADRFDGRPQLFVSHLGAAELVALRERRPGFDVRPRVGTQLWLGDRGALRVRAQVLDTHPVERGERIGYRQRPMPVGGTLLVVSGGTAHGIGLEAPTAASGLRQRATSLAKGGLEAAGLALSPFSVGGKQRWFAEPPHMQASMLLLPSSVRVPEVGDELDVQVRFTTTRFDVVDVS
ncbi:alanine racemase [Solicola sp. PLA-1-18]|uniref:alanine racemase n=1 Tax=Solicola sp. PLA-1-18 TaxID=3380532 RepID=UPI003B75D922